MRIIFLVSARANISAECVYEPACAHSTREAADIWASAFIAGNRKHGIEWCCKVDEIEMDVVFDPVQ